ncbi:MAG: RnfABCDGE type electron transport complex subunit B [Candidatus Omnitrophica bacterium]|nr:RnfABCDGE type electron transport complex subunit B [Candidatus Omnitrophota bacterium]
MLVPILTLSILGLLFGIGLSLAFKVFKVEEDPNIGKILEFLPGANCGACGYAGCFGLAEAIAKGKASPISCAPANTEAKQKISAILGKELKEETKLVATLICNGGGIATDKFIYQGTYSCIAANLLSGGQKTCPYGCLGFGDCEKVCPFGAIYIDRDKQLPVINETKCTACGLCIKACPKKILVLRPMDKKIYVMCNSLDKGFLVSKYCKNGCIGCLKCEKVCPSDAIHVKNNLALIDYAKCTQCGECVKVCPTKVIHPSNTLLKEKD